MAAKPGGIVAFWVAAVAFLVMALWRLVEAALAAGAGIITYGLYSFAMDRYTKM